MRNYEQRIQELETAHAGKRAQLDREIALLRTLPENLAELESMAHLSRLYDRVGSLHFNYCRYDSIRHYRPATFADVLELARVYPPVALAIFRDGCVGIRTLTDAQQAREKAQARMVEGSETSAIVTPIGPFWLTFQAASYTSEMAIHFIGQTPLGLMEMKVEFPIYGEMARKIGSVQIRRTGCGRFAGDPSRIVSKSLELTPACRVLGNGRGETLRYGNGGDNQQEPGGITLYYDSANGEPASVTLADLGRAIGEPA